EQGGRIRRIAKGGLAQGHCSAARLAIAARAANRLAATVFGSPSKPVPPRRQFQTARLRRSSSRARADRQMDRPSCAFVHGWAELPGHTAREFCRAELDRRRSALTACSGGRTKPLLLR